MHLIRRLAKKVILILSPSIRRLIADRDAALADRADRDAALADRDAALADRDAALADRDTALADRDTARALSSQALSERDALRAQVQSPLSFEASTEPATFSYLPPVLVRSGESLQQPPLDLFQKPFFDPLNVDISPDLAAHPRLNILLPSTSVAHNSGGPNSMYLLAAEMVKREIPLRFIAVSMPADSDNGLIRDHIAAISGVSRELVNKIEFIDASDRCHPISLGENDLFFATAWWTAQMLKYLLPRFNCQCFAYLIQDFEPNLHTSSVNSAMALETYGMDYMPVVNSQLLYDHFVQKGVGRFADPNFAGNRCWFEPAVDRKLYYPQAHPADMKRRLLFYARPNVPRNLIEFGLAALMFLVNDGTLQHEHWDFFSSVIGVGGGCRPICLSDDGKSVLAPLSLYDLKDWASEMRRTDVVLSLIWSPHTSYPPLEGAASGCMVATNTCGVKTVKRLQEISSNIVAGPPTIEGVSESLREAVLRSYDWEARVAGAQLGSPKTWTDSFHPILPQLFEFLRSTGISALRD